MKKQIKEWNLVRGFTITLVIICHSIFIDMINQSPDFQVAKYFYRFICSFAMPLFFFISGFFALKSLSNIDLDKYKKLISNKFKRLFIPYIIFSILGGAIKFLLSSFAHRPVDFISIIRSIIFYPYINPIMLLWYLYTLFMMFILFPPILKLVKNLNIVLIVLLVLDVLPFFYGERFNIDGVVRYGFYFILGLKFNTYYNEFYNFKNKILAGILALIPLCIMNLFIISNNFHALYVVITSLLGITAFMNLIFSLKPESKSWNTLEVIGEYSFDLYLLHWFMQMPFRILYQKGTINYPTLFICSFCFAFASILISKYIIRKSKILSRFMLGKYK